MKTPRIGETVWHTLPDGTTIRDWCAQVLLVVGKDDKGRDITEQGVIVWGATRLRHVPGFDVWKEGPP